MRTSEKNRNHPLVLGRSSKTGAEGEGYTIFKNTDEELLKKIKALNVPIDTFKEYGKKGNCKIVQELNDVQRLCVDEAGEYFIKKEHTFAETKTENLLNEINKKFSVSAYLNTIPMFSNDGYRKITFTEHGGLMGEGWHSLGRVMSHETGVYLNTYRGIELIEGNCGGTAMFCHFNVDGNVANRDYNYDIKEFLDNKQKTRQDLIEEIISHIPDESYKNYGNKWFAANHAFVLEKVEPGQKSRSGNYQGKLVFKLTRYDRPKYGSSDTYGDSISGKIKLPKTATPSSREDILSKILPLVNENKFVVGDPVDLSKYINQEKLSNSKSDNKPAEKRVQKTKLDEKKFSEVYDWVNEKFVTEEDELMKALSNLENGIEIGESEDIIKDMVVELLSDGDLPSFSFNKGQKQPNHSKYIGLVKLPHGCNFTFKVEEGEPCEITWEHSIYYTDVVDFELVP